MSKETSVARPSASTRWHKNPVSMTVSAAVRRNSFVIQDDRRRMAPTFQSPCSIRAQLFQHARRRWSLVRRAWRFCFGNALQSLAWISRRRWRFARSTLKFMTIRRELVGAAWLMFSPALDPPTSTIFCCTLLWWNLRCTFPQVHIVSAAAKKVHHCESRIWLEISLGCAAHCTFLRPLGDTLNTR